MALLQAKWSNAGSGTPIKEVPTGTINGSNINFVTSQVPKTGTLLVFIDKVLEVNYTYTNGTKTIAFTTAPQAGQDVYVAYSY
jgi:hypothetical protein